jgi:hypothetical protein
MMNVEELLKIIKKEKLDRYYAYMIGHPDGKPIAFKEIIGTDTEGIYCDENEIWRFYRISERGGISYAMVGEYTESEACEELLRRMRLMKDVALHGW